MARPTPLPTQPFCFILITSPKADPWAPALGSARHNQSQQESKPVITAACTWKTPKREGLFMPKGTGVLRMRRINLLKKQIGGVWGSKAAAPEALWLLKLQEKWRICTWNASGVVEFGEAAQPPCLGCESISYPALFSLP